MRALILRTFLLLAVVSATAGTAPSLHVSGGLTLNGAVEPLLFTWNSAVPVSGGGWAAGETVQIVLHGPLDTPGVAPRSTRGVAVRVSGSVSAESIARPIRRPFGPPPVPAADIPLGVATPDTQGNLSAAPKIPYDSGIVGPQARIPRPGYYELRAIGSVSGTVASPDRISLCPDTYTGPGATATFDWGHERGGRDGVFPGALRAFSPERFDPEWPTVWEERPVEVYGTVVASDGTGSDQPSRVSPSDNPPTHYAHDAIMFLDPDPSYRWLIGTANYYNGEPDSADLGHLEVEWETRNAGSTATYDQGNIGLPVWANPAPGDRVFVVGRWILDAGHPEVGDRTEIHPPRLMATMRSRPTLLGSAAAAQVDLYVSGHGGGANSMPPGLSAVLDQGGHGGGRIRDVLSASDQDRYYRPGPLSLLLYPLVVEVIRQATGVTISANIFPDAGPSAFPWGSPGVEERPVNDRDYDFDVPLPPAPSGGGSVVMDAVTQPEHTTSVNEVVTYTGPANGPPTTAHIHLPYRGADSGIYARTLRFSWSPTTAPASHWTVRLTRIDVADSAGKWQMWSDVSGHWTYLSGAAPQLLSTANGGSITLPGTPVDVYLNAGQTIHVDVHGYRAACLDDFFGKLFGDSSYVAGLAFVAQCGPNDNQDLGIAGLDLPIQPSPAGTHTVQATDAAGNHHFSITVSVDGQ